MNLRPATLADSDFLFACKNELHTIEMSVSQRPVTREEHDRWLPNIIAAPGVLIFIAELGEMMVGTGRIDYGKNGVCILSYSVMKDHRGHSYGAAIVWMLCAKAKSLGFTQIRATVSGKNWASLSILSGVGFAIHEPKWLELTKELG